MSALKGRQKEVCPAMQILPRLGVNGNEKRFTSQTLAKAGERSPCLQAGFCVYV